MEREKPKLDLDHDEMAIRKIYWLLVEKGKLTKVFRPGRRFCGEYRGYCSRQMITIKMIDAIGSDFYGLGPVFTPGKELKASISKIEVKMIKDLEPVDFIGSSPDVYDRESLRYHLGLIYNLSLEDLSDDSFVTLISLDYLNFFKKEKLENLLALNDLLRNETLVYAKLAIKNPQTINFPKLVLTLINHDYPARTPLLWNAVYDHFGFEHVSVALASKSENLKEEDFKSLVQSLRGDDRYLGGGFGVGFKDEIVNYLDELDDSAKNVGAANFAVKTADNKIRGYNTDGEGFVSSLQESFSDLKSLANKRVLLIGSGGTARAIVFSLVKAGAKVIIANRTLSRAQELADSVNNFYQLTKENLVKASKESEIINYVENLDVLVNASIKGAEGDYADYLALASTDKGLVENRKEAEKIFAKINPSVVIADIVLRNADTPLIAEAKRLGLKQINGLPMVIYQAVAAFFILHSKELALFKADENNIYQIMKSVSEKGQ